MFRLYTKEPIDNLLFGSVEGWLKFDFPTTNKKRSFKPKSGLLFFPCQFPERPSPSCFVGIYQPALLPLSLISFCSDMKLKWPNNKTQHRMHAFINSKKRNKDLNKVSFTRFNYYKTPANLYGYQLRPGSFSILKQRRGLNEPKISSGSFMTGAPPDWFKATRKLNLDPYKYHESRWSSNNPKFWGLPHNILHINGSPRGFESWHVSPSWQTFIDGI